MMKNKSEMDAQLTAHQIRLVQAIADLQMAQSAVTFICEIDADQRMIRSELRRYRCYEDAAVIAYGRAFTEARGLPILSLKKLSVRPDPDQKSLHERLLERRHQVVAHSDAERQRISFRTIGFNIDNRTIMMPKMDFDDSLTFFIERESLREWLSILISNTCTLLFHQVQSSKEIDFVRDYSLAPAPSAAEEQP